MLRRPQTAVADHTGYRFVSELARGCGVIRGRGDTGPLTARQVSRANGPPPGSGPLIGRIIAVPGSARTMSHFASLAADANRSVCGGRALFGRPVTCGARLLGKLVPLCQLLCFTSFGTLDVPLGSSLAHLGARHLITSVFAEPLVRLVRSDGCASGRRCLSLSCLAPSLMKLMVRWSESYRTTGRRT